jgi:ArsR family transcriptional regulator
MQDLNQMQEKAEEVSNFIKCFCNPTRLMIFCQLTDGEKSVSELLCETGIAQTSMSQHLKVLKDEGLIDFRRDHRTLFYYICNDQAKYMMQSLYELFCKSNN